MSSIKWPFSEMFQNCTFIDENENRYKMERVQYIGHSFTYLYLNKAIAYSERQYTNLKPKVPFIKWHFKIFRNGPKSAFIDENRGGILQLL
jgi:hypothetical protein